MTRIRACDGEVAAAQSLSPCRWSFSSFLHFSLLGNQRFLQVNEMVLHHTLAVPLVYLFQRKSNLAGVVSRTSYSRNCSRLLTPSSARIVCLADHVGWRRVQLYCGFSVRCISSGRTRLVETLTPSILSRDDHRVLLTFIGSHLSDIDDNLLAYRKVRVGSSVACWHAAVRERDITAVLSPWAAYKVSSLARVCNGEVDLTCSLTQKPECRAAMARWLRNRDDHQVHWLNFGGTARARPSRKRRRDD